MTNKIIPADVQKYLQKYSLPVWKLEHSKLHPITAAIVIPAINEYQNIQTLLSSLIKNDWKYFDECIFIFVINNLSTSSEEVKKDNEKTLRFLRKIINEDVNDLTASQIIKTGIQIAVVDASSAGLEMTEKDGGVGFARKIGMDLALNVFDYTSEKKKIIICLDADCTVEPDYLSEVINFFHKKNISAAIVNFEHDSSGNDLSTCAIICYEIFLRYYVLGLKYALSSFAFHTIGSCMACDYNSYIKIEGMNKRKAAEDFYFLEKLAKIVSVKSINTTIVHPSSRSSWRVPFGTGQRINRFISCSKNEYLLYDPLCFDILKKWLKLFTSEDVYEAEYYLTYAEKIHPELFVFLNLQNFNNDWTRILGSSKSSGQINNQKQKWFDGFRTLKLIHHLRDSAFPEINMFDALDQLFTRLISEHKIKRDEIIPGLDVQREYLSILKSLEKNYTLL